MTTITCDTRASPIFQDEVPLVACSSTCRSTPTRLDECILCQTKTRSDYLSSVETGRARIISLAKEDGGDDTRAQRVVDLSVQEMQIMKYHSSMCYKKFQRDMEKNRKQESNDVEPSVAIDDAENDNDQRRKKA